MWKEQLIYYAIGLCIICAVTLVFIAMAPPGTAVSVSASEVSLCEAYLASIGYETGDLIESAEAVIPAVPDKGYESYQKLQKQAGLDLSPYRGRKVMRYTFSLLNFPVNMEGIRANLLICDEKIIGGDFCTVNLDGFMSALLPRDQISGELGGQLGVDGN